MIKAIAVSLPEFFKDEAEFRALWSEPEAKQRIVDDGEAAGAFQ